MFFNFFIYLVIILLVGILAYAVSGALGLVFVIILLLIPAIWQYYNGPKKKK